MEPYRDLTFFHNNGEKSYMRMGENTKKSAPALRVSIVSHAIRRKYQRGSALDTYRPVSHGKLALWIVCQEINLMHLISQWIHEVEPEKQASPSFLPRSIIQILKSFHVTPYWINDCQFFPWMIWLVLRAHSTCPWHNIMPCEVWEAAVNEWGWVLEWARCSVRLVRLCWAQQSGGPSASASPASICRASCVSLQHCIAVTSNTNLHICESGGGPRGSSKEEN